MGVPSARTEGHPLPGHRTASKSVPIRTPPGCFARITRACSRHLPATCRRWQGLAEALQRRLLQLRLTIMSQDELMEPLSCGAAGLRSIRSVREWPSHKAIIIHGEVSLRKEPCNATHVSRRFILVCHHSAVSAWEYDPTPRANDNDDANESPMTMGLMVMGRLVRML
jgi:hypothetical protein